MSTEHSDEFPPPDKDDAKAKRINKPKGDAPNTEARAKRKKRRIGGGESKHSERRLEAVEETQRNALEYRKMGLSYAQIAEKMGLNSAQTAWNAVESALKRVLKEPAEEVRKIELARLDAMFIKPYNAALSGDLMALTAALNIMNRRARLLGIDAPTLVKADTTLTTPNAKGVMVVGAVMSPEQWAEIAQDQQAQLTTDTTEQAGQAPA